jgi:hypothetical protein
MRYTFPTAHALRARYLTPFPVPRSPSPLSVPTPRAHSPIVLMLAPQAADTPRKGSIYVLSTPDDLALSDFGLLQDCQLMTAIMVQFLEVKHRSKKKLSHTDREA